MPTRFAHVDNWVFDLDNTLYPPECALFELIDERMRDFIAKLLNISEAEAHHVQKSYFRDHGTTLAGLMTHQNICPQQFLDFVHDIDLSRLEAAPRLRDALDILPGRKIIFTNADTPYAEKVLTVLGLDNLFNQICDIHDMAYIPKPQDSAYKMLLNKTGIDPAHSLFVEDMARNLAPAKALGMTTIWVNNGSEYGSRDLDPAFIDLEISNLADWLYALPHSTRGQI